MTRDEAMNVKLSPKMLSELIYLCCGGIPAAVKRSTIDGLHKRGLVDGRGHPTPDGRLVAEVQGRKV